VSHIHDEPVRTQYAEIKERVRSAGYLLPGTPGSLVTRSVKGTDYLYRAYYAVSGKRVDAFIGLASDAAAREAQSRQIAFAEWTQTRVGQLRRLGFQVADKQTARVLVELHNLGMFEAGLVLVGTLAYMTWLNELGVAATASRTRDIDVARAEHLKLAAPLEFLTALKATELPFVAVPGLPSRSPSTSVKLPGVEGLRVDVLAPGPRLGAPIRVPEIAWHAQAIPHFDYLLSDPEPAAVLAGGHCIPVRVPQVGRLVWHKLFSSRRRRGEPEKSAKDRSQAVALAVAMQHDRVDQLDRSFREAAPSLRTALSPLLAGFAAELQDLAPEAHDVIDQLRSRRGRRSRGR
jgi:hypothetical protein